MSSDHQRLPNDQSLHATSLNHPSKHPRKCGPSPPEGIVQHDNLGARVLATERHCASDVHTSQVVVAQAGGQLPIAILLDPTVSSTPNEDSAVDFVYTSWTLWAYTKAKRLISAGLFPASSWYHYLFDCTLDEGAAEASRRSEYLARWETALISIARSWKHTQSITTSVLLVSSLAILQLDTVLNNRDICTCMAASIVLALASIFSSFIYSMSKDKFISRWKTSEAPDASFWRCIAMPLDFAIWSFIFFIIAVFTLIYQRMLSNKAEAASDQRSPEVALRAAGVTILSIISIWRIYYGLFVFYCT